MKKIISILITVCILSAAFAIPAAAQRTVSSLTKTENPVGTSAIYLGEFQNGSQTVKYIWSADYLDYSYYHRYDDNNVEQFTAESAAGIAEEALGTLKTALAGMDDTDYYDLIADVDPAAYGNNPLAFCTDPTLVPLMNESWASAAQAGQSVNPGKHPLNESSTPAYDADAGFGAAVDALRAERIADMDSPLTGDEKLIVNHIDSGVITNVRYEIEDGEAVRYVDENVWYDSETTEVILTRADTFVDIYDVINAAIAAHEESVDVSGMGITTDTVEDFLYDVYNRCPYQYLFDFFSYSYRPSQETPGLYEVTSLIPHYVTTSDEAAAKLAEVNAVVDSIVSWIPEGASDEEKLICVHDWLVVNSAYDRTYTYHDAYTILTQGTGVCDAYSYAMMTVCNRLGIPCVRMTSSSMNHAWNIVKIDGEWYHIDATWDDPTADRLGRVRHSHFLVSDEKIKTLNHSGFEEGLCTSDRFDDAYWKNTNSQVVFLNGDLYYIETVSDSSLYGFSGAIFRAGESAPVHTFTAAWGPADMSYFWTQAYSGLAVHEGKLVYNTPTQLVSLNTATGETETLYEYTGEKRIYALFTDRNSDIVCVLGVDPNASDDELFIPDLPVSVVYGDADGSGDVNLTDANLLKQFMANYDYDTLTSTVAVSAGADANGDGEINLTDANLLKLYMANYDYDTGTSTVVLGPAAA